VATSLWAASTIFASVSWISMCPGRVPFGSSVPLAPGTGQL
jgi:hypothetical protein